MDRHLYTHAGELVLSVAIAASFCCRPDELSLLAFAAHVGGAGGLQPLIGVKDGALAFRIAEGAAALPERVADTLENTVRLDSPVVRIERTGDSVMVSTADGMNCRARRVVIAFDPASASSIEHDPPLPVARRELQARYWLGSGIKAHVIYPCPWWRDVGLSGSVVADTGTTRLTFDVSPSPQADRRTPGVLLALIGLPAIDEPQSLSANAVDQRRRRVRR